MFNEGCVKVFVFLSQCSLYYMICCLVFAESEIYYITV